MLLIVISRCYAQTTVSINNTTYTVPGEKIYEGVIGIRCNYCTGTLSILGGSTNSSVHYLYNSADTIIYSSIAKCGTQVMGLKQSFLLKNDILSITTDTMNNRFHLIVKFKPWPHLSHSSTFKVSKACDYVVEKDMDFD